MIESIHSQEVIEMMRGKTFTREAIIDKMCIYFGRRAEYRTGEGDYLRAWDLIDYLLEKGVLVPTGDPDGSLRLVGGPTKDS